MVGHCWSSGGVRPATWLGHDCMQQLRAEAGSRPQRASKPSALHPAEGASYTRPPSGRGLWGVGLCRTGCLLHVGSSAEAPRIPRHLACRPQPAARVFPRLDETVLGRLGCDPAVALWRVAVGQPCHRPQTASHSALAEIRRQPRLSHRVPLHIAGGHWAAVVSCSLVALLRRRRWRRRLHALAQFLAHHLNQILAHTYTRPASCHTRRPPPCIPLAAQPVPLQPRGLESWTAHEGYALPRLCPCPRTTPPSAPRSCHVV